MNPRLIILIALCAPTLAATALAAVSLGAAAARDRNDRGEVDGMLIAGLVVLVMFLLLFTWGAIGARP